MIKLLNWIITFLRNTNPVVATTFTAGSAALSIWALFQSMWGSLMQRVDALAVNASGGTLNFQPLALVNYVFPLTEMLNLIIAYGAIRLLCAGIRIIKSFVPSIA